MALTIELKKRFVRRTGAYKLHVFTAVTLLYYIYIRDSFKISMQSELRFSLKSCKIYKKTLCNIYIVDNYEKN